MKSRYYSNYDTGYRLSNPRGVDDPHPCAENFYALYIAIKMEVNSDVALRKMGIVPKQYHPSMKSRIGEACYILNKICTISKTNIASLIGCHVTTVREALREKGVLYDERFS